MKRIYSLDFLKLVFAYIIAFFHFGTLIPPGSTVTVQIFFIISGYFLARKYYRRSHTDGGRSYSPWQYTLDHAKSIYPHYLFSLAVFFLYMLARSVLELLRSPSADGLAAIVKDCYYQIPDLMLVQSAYRFHESLNYPLWQLSALVIAGYFVYALLCHNERLSRQILFPAAILMIQSLLHTGIDLFENYGFFYLPLLRAFSPLCVGVLAYYFTTTSYYSQITKHRVPFNLAVLLSLAGIFLLGDAANIFLLTTPILLWGCREEDSWLNRLLNHRVFRHCGKFSYAIYLNHAFIARFLQARVLARWEMAGWMQNLLYFLVLTVYSVFTLILVESLLARRRAKAAV